MAIFFEKRVDLKSLVIIIAVTFTLVGILAENITGNYYIAPGKYGTQKYYIDKGNYVSSKENSQCNKVGGIIVNKGVKSMFKDIPVELISVSKDVVLIKVNGARRAMEYGSEKFVGGLFVTVFSAGDEDACLIVRDYY